MPAKRVTKNIYFIHKLEAGRPTISMKPNLESRNLWNPIFELASFCQERQKFTCKFMTEYNSVSIRVEFTLIDIKLEWFSEILNNDTNFLMQDGFEQKVLKITFSDFLDTLKGSTNSGSAEYLLNPLLFLEMDPRVMINHLCLNILITNLALYLHEK